MFFWLATMSLEKAHIPICPAKDFRVSVKVDRELYDRAKKHRIDVHTLFRLTLQEAVTVLEKEIYVRNQNNNHDSHTESAFFGAMVRSDDEQREPRYPRGPQKQDSKRTQAEDARAARMGTSLRRAREIL